MTGVLINADRSIADVPASAPLNDGARSGDPWEDWENHVLEILLPLFGVQRTAWSLLRSTDAIRTRAVKLHVSYARQQRPCPDTRGGVA